MYQRFLQTEFWTGFKAQHQWKAHYFKIENSADESKDDFSLNEISSEEYKSQSYSNAENYFALLTRTFSIKIKTFSIAYIAMAFEYDESKQADKKEAAKLYFKKLESIAEKVKPFIPSNTICLRFDPPIDFYSIQEKDDFLKNCDSLLKTKEIKTRRSLVAVQPPDTTILNLEKSEDEILQNMKSKWRYNIRLSSKKGVCVEKYDFSSEKLNDAFEKFYKLFSITSKRDGVSFHGKQYYLDLLGKKDDDVKIRLYLAKHEDDYLAGIITLFCKREAVYLYGASGNIKRNLMPAYLLQWTAIKDAKDYGCPVYDFYGMPPTDDENHPMHGLYLFKTGFGGAIIHRPGSFDIPLNEKNYRLYIRAEKFRAWFHKKFLKKLRGR